VTTPDTGDRLTALRQSLGRTGIWAPPPELLGADGGFAFSGLAPLAQAVAGR